MQPELTQYELRRMADRMFKEAEDADRPVVKTPPPTDWRQRYVDQAAASETLQAALNRHVRRARRWKWIIAAQAVVIAGLV